MMSETAFAPWPLPMDAPLGLDLARRIIAWAKVEAPPLVAEAEHMLVSRHRGATDIHTSAWSLRQLVDQETMPSGSISLGVVSANVASGTHAMVTIGIREDGYLELQPGMGMV